MNILIVGCGKTGARLANELDDYGFDVSVVDADAHAFSGSRPSSAAAATAAIAFITLKSPGTAM